MTVATRHAATFATGPQNVPFSSAVGSASPWQYVDLFISSEFIEHIVSRTADRLRENGLKPTTADELNVFLWLRAYIGIVDMPRLKMYWQKDGLYGKKFVRERMSRDRFLELQRNCTFDLDRLEHIMRENCKRYWIPRQTVDLDEAIAPFRGKYRSQSIHSRETEADRAEVPDSHR